MSRCCAVIRSAKYRPTSKLCTHYSIYTHQLYIFVAKPHLNQWHKTPQCVYLDMLTFVPTIPLDRTAMNYDVLSSVVRRFSIQTDNLLSFILRILPVLVIQMWKVGDIIFFCQNGKMDLSKRQVFKTSDMLVRVRLFVYIVAFMHLVFIATKLLTIDFTKADDPALWVYADIRWKLITCWFNLASLAYLPICIYCDWRENRREASWRHVKKLNWIRYTLFTSFLFPTTSFADILFWRLWNKDRLLLAPPGVDAIVPFWTQHCMHTVTLVFTLLDLVLVPRKRPPSMIPGLSLMMLFIAAYSYVCADSLTKGEILYPVLKTMNSFKLAVLLVYIVVEHLFYFTGQFFVYDFLWGRSKTENEHIKSYK